MERTFQVGGTTCEVGSDELVRETTEPLEYGPNTGPELAGKGCQVKARKRAVPWNTVELSLEV